jgi:hypothetical protein
MNEMHEANRKRWDLEAPRWKMRRDTDWRKCLDDPSLGFERGSLG